MSGRLRVERRPDPPLWVRVAMPVGAVAAGLLAGVLVLLLSGDDVAAAYTAMWDASLGSRLGFEQTLVTTTPLILTGLAVLCGLRMGLWNIGAEGQLAMGAIGAAAAGAVVAGASVPVALVAMFAAGMAAGALWACIAAIPRALIGLNEIITTLFLNYIALLLMAALITGPWADRSAIGFARSRNLAGDVELPLIGSSRVSIGILLALAAVVIAWWLIDRTRWGFAVRVAGGNQRAAEYLRLGIRRRIVAVLALSGALAAAAGVIEFTTVTGGRLQGGLTNEYGYVGILIAFLARGSFALMVGVAFLYAALLTGGLALQSTGVPSSIATIIQGLIIVFVLLGEWLARHRVRVLRESAQGAVPPAASSAAPEVRA